MKSYIIKAFEINRKAHQITINSFIINNCYYMMRISD